MVLMPAMNPALYCCTHYHIIFFVIHVFVQITIVQCIICFVIHDLTNLLDSFTIVYVSRKIYIWYWTDMSSFTHRRFFTKKFLHTGTLTRRCPSFYTQELLHTRALQKEAFRHRNFYSFFTRKLLRRSFCTEMPLQTEAFTHRSFYSEKPLNRAAFTHTEAFTQRRFCTEKLFHRQAFAGRNFEHKRFLHTAAFTQRSLCADQLLHSGLFSQSSVYAEHLWRREAFTHRGFHTEALHREASTQRSI